MGPLDPKRDVSQSRLETQRPSPPAHTRRRHAFPHAQALVLVIRHGTQLRQGRSETKVLSISRGIGARVKRAHLHGMRHRAPVVRVAAPGRQRTHPRIQDCKVSRHQRWGEVSSCGQDRQSAAVIRRVSSCLQSRHCEFLLERRVRHTHLRGQQRRCAGSVRTPPARSVHGRVTWHSVVPRKPRVDLSQGAACCVGQVTAIRTQTPTMTLSFTLEHSGRTNRHAPTMKSMTLQSPSGWLDCRFLFHSVCATSAVLYRNTLLLMPERQRIFRTLVRNRARQSRQTFPRIELTPSSVPSPQLVRSGSRQYRLRTCA